MNDSNALLQQPGPPHLAQPSSQAAGAVPPNHPGHAPGRQLASAALLQGGKSVEIHHNGAVYRLQATKLGKLILTK